MVLTRYRVTSPRVPRPLKIASVADLHNGRPAPVLSLLEEGEPDLVAVPGDLVDDAAHRDRGLAFLRECTRRYPTFISLGNHESRAEPDTLLPLLAKSGAELLDDRVIHCNGLAIGGLSSGWRAEMHQHRTHATPPPDTRPIAALSAASEYRILLCHHPEYYPQYLKDTPIELILSGHAHGGQWCFFGQGIFAPGQGLFPRYTAGLYDGRMALSRGLCSTHRYIPRLFNPREVLLISLEREPSAAPQ